MVLVLRYNNLIYMIIILSYCHNCHHR